MMGKRLCGRFAAWQLGRSFSRCLATLAATAWRRFLARRQPAAPRLFRPTGEQFESRQLLSTLTWTGSSSDSFSDPQNWVVTAGDDLNVVRAPASSDDVIINAASSQAKVRVVSGTASVHSISSTDGIGKPFEILSGSTLSLAAASTFQNTLSVGGTITGDGVVTVAGAMAWSGGTIKDLDTGVSTVFNVNGGLTLSGATKNLTGRTLQLNSNTVWTGGTIALSDATINNAPGVEFDMPGLNLTMNSPVPSQFVNSGTVSRSPGTINTATVKSSFTNTATGTINVRSGTLKLDGPLSNLNAGVLTGGTYILNGALQLASGANISTIAASVTLDGASAQLMAGTASALANLATIGPAGSFTLENGADFASSGSFSNAGVFAVQDSTSFATAADFTNAGSVTIGNASKLSIGGGANYTQTAGSTKLTDSLSRLAVGGLADIQAGTISGLGTVEGSLTSGGQLSPGNSPGQLTVTGSYKQNAAAALNIEIGGLTPGSQADQLRVDEALSLAGALNVALINAYVPLPGDRFRIVSKTNFGAVSGTFAGLSEGASFLVGPIPFQITYLAGLNNNNVELTALPPVVSIDSVSLPEGDSGTTAFDFPVRLSFPSNKTISVTVNTSDGSATAGSDYKAVTNQVITFDPGQTLKTVTISVTGDPIKEADETFTATLSQLTGPATIIDNHGAGTILNDDTLPAVSIADASLTEGDGGAAPLSFTISLTAPAAVPVSGTFSTIDGSAMGDDDFAPQTAANWSIPVGQTSATISVPISGDFAIEGTETFSVLLAGLTNGLAGRMSATGTINDNDSRFLTVSDPAGIVEGDTGAKDLTFTIKVNEARADGPITGTFSTTGGTAASGVDFASQSGVAWKIAQGQTATTISVPIVGDFAIEPDETFSVALADVIGADTHPAVGGNASAIGTILNDDSRLVTIADAQLIEGDSGTENMKFTILVNSPRADGPVSGTFSTAALAATSNIDFAAQTNTGWTIPKGQTSAAIYVPIFGDTLIEGPETFTVTLADVVGADASPAVGGDPTAIGTILNDDHPKISIGDESVVEGDRAADDKRLTFTLTLSEANADETTVLVSTADITAVGGEDYKALNNLLVTIPAAAMMATFQVDVQEDFDIEPDEQFSVALSSPSANAILDPVHHSAIGTILNDDDRTLAISSAASVVEGDFAADDRRLTFTVTLSQAIPQDVTVFADTSDASAVANQDYVPLSGLVVTIPANQTTASFQVEVLEDIDAEKDETLGVKLRGSSPNARIDASRDSGAGTIANDDFLLLSIDDVSRSEGQADTTPLAFEVALAANPLSPVSVTVNTADGTATTADDDYAAVSDLVLTFLPGQARTQKVVVPAKGDTKFEQDQTFRVDLSNPTGGATIESGQGLGTIVNDDTRPTISISDRAVKEQNDSSSNALFDVTLSNPTDEIVSVRLDTADGTAATADDDYLPVVDRLISFAPGSTLEHSAIEILGDARFEPDESFFVNLSAAANAAGIADSQGLCTIQNDDGRPTVQITDVSHSEGNSGASAYLFTVSLSKPSSEEVTLRYETAGDSATAADGDYDSQSGTLSFAANTQTLAATFSIEVNGDTKFEPDERFFVNLSNLINAAPSGNDLEGVGAIVNDDARPKIHIAAASQAEGDSGQTPLAFTLSLSNPSVEVVTVSWQTADGVVDAARASRDYAAVAPTLVTFDPGETTRSLPVMVQGDTFFEPDETFAVNLSGATNASIADAQAVGTIVNDDPPGAPPLYPIAAKDDGELGYQERGNWTPDSGGFLGDVRTHAPGIGTSTAVWSLNVAAGKYQIFTTWTPAADRATNAPYAVFIDGIGQGGVKQINQQRPPGDGNFDNRLWESLGVFEVGSGRIDVQLSNAANGVVAADAVIAVPLAGGGDDVVPNDPGSTSPLPLLSLDANNDGSIAPSDALLVINYLNSRVSLPLGPAGLGGAFSIDVNADQNIAPLDALLIINDINARGFAHSAEGEPADALFSALGASDPADGVLWQILSLDTPARGPKRR